MPIDRSIMLFNGKGGVGKSSIAANLAGLVALGGWKVLVVDLDKQGNRALGVRVGGATQTLSTRDPWQAWLVAA